MRGIACSILTAGLLIASRGTDVDDETATFAGRCLWVAVILTCAVVAWGI